MKRLLLALYLCCLGVVAFGARTETIPLYATPSTTATVVGKVALGAPLTPIFKQGDWLKVGNPKNGEVGWLNLGAYQKQVQAQAPSQITRIYIPQTTQQGNPQVIVYENGRLIKGKEAAAVYQAFKAQQAKINQQFDQVAQQFNQVMSNQLDAMGQLMHQLIATVPLPRVLVLQGPPPAEAAASVPKASAPASSSVKASNTALVKKIHQNFQTTSRHILSATQAIQDLHQKNSAVAGQ